MTEGGTQLTGGERISGDNRATRKRSLRQGGERGRRGIEKDQEERNPSYTGNYHPTRPDEGLVHEPNNAGVAGKEGGVFGLLTRSTVQDLFRVGII